MEQYNFPSIVLARKEGRRLGLSLIGLVAPGRNSQRSLEACTCPRHLIENLLGHITHTSQTPESLKMTSK